MHDAFIDQIDAHDIFISAAAVADYRPATYQDDKIKKHDDTLTLELIKNPDILLDVSQRTNCPFLVGFAAESNTPLENGRAKLAIKNLDMIAINDISKPGIGFGSNDNALTVLAAQQHADPVVYELAQTDKLHLAEQLLQLMEKHYDASCSN
jgi:phosphopantothenoylcysteine decarboxylase/phosphopantothenate--cysteine ligase